MTKSKHQGQALFDLLGDSQDEINDSLRPSHGVVPSKPPPPPPVARPETEQAIEQKPVRRTRGNGYRSPPAPPVRVRRRVRHAFADQLLGGHRRVHRFGRASRALRAGADAW